MLEKDTKFDFDDAYKVSFNEIKVRLVLTHVMETPDWNNDFEIMFDPCDFAMGAVLGQRIERTLRAIYYASKTFNEAHENYSTTEKKMLAMIFAYEKY